MNLSPFQTFLGINPQKLSGSKTGVYIGYSTFGYQDGERNAYQPDAENYPGEEMFGVQGEAKCLYANRISYVFDFKGPSIILDTACSSSLVALNYAFKDMILGMCPCSFQLYQTNRFKRFI